MIPTIKKSTIVTRQSTTAIYHILTNCFTNCDFKIVIFKSDIFQHFPINFFVPITNEFSKTELIYTHEIILNNDTIEMFRQKLQELTEQELKYREI